MKPSRRRCALTGAALATVLIIGGCGSDSTSQPTSPVTSTPSVQFGSPVVVSDVWSRSSATGQTLGVVYLQMRNTGSTDDALVSASVPRDVAASVELHETVNETARSTAGSDPVARADDSAPMDSTGATMAGSTPMGTSGVTDGTAGMGNGAMSMRSVEKIDIPAGATTALQPGGFHIMLIDLTKPLAAGDIVPVTLTFAGGEKLTVSAAVRDE